MTGVVQGVGFRPFVKRLADRLGVAGRVWNDSGGVVVEAATSDPERFVRLLRAEAPPGARIETCSWAPVPDPAEWQDFHIVLSEPVAGAFTLVSPDLAICADCLRDILDRTGRRFGYPFTNCTNCGPRYSITCDIPYDRPNTTMAPFGMCPECRREYDDPGNRRFHAQPNACPACGPRLSEAVDGVLNDGRILALRGLGGFQLACDAFSAESVSRLRERKRRSRKPFAVMMRDLATIERYCFVNARERELLTSRAAPIVLLRMRDPGDFPPDLAPGLRELGVMLPYTPLHHLLFRDRFTCLVMTSGNLAEEPIVISNEAAREKLASLADEFLCHDREIFMRVDDSVVRRDGIIRRARGYAPDPFDLGYEAGEVLACGGELKNTFCLTKGRYAILSQHIGDLENLETLEFFEETLRNLKKVYRAEPRLVAHDLHPDYLSTRWALRQPEPRIAVQHHWAHIASCMAENHLRGPVIGVAWDGTGYGTDRQIWGGEFLVCDYERFERVAHFRYVPLVGGDKAARECWRIAAAHLHDAFGTDFLRYIEVPKVFERLLARATLKTSSSGRLFDAVSAITGVCRENTYEGEAAMLLEAAAAREEFGEFPFRLEDGVIDTRPMIRAIAEEHDPAVVSSRFHSTLASIITKVALEVRERTGIAQVCFSGGTFQNRTLVRRVVPRLEDLGFQVFTQKQVPPNDGGLALGQAAIAAACLTKRRTV